MNMLTGDMLMLGHAHALTYGHAHTILHCVKNGSLSDFNILSVNIVAKSKKLWFNGLFFVVYLLFSVVWNPQLEGDSG